MMRIQSRIRSCIAVLVLGAAVATAGGCKKKGADSSGGAASSSAPAAGGEVASCNSAALHQCREYNADNLAAGSDSLGKLCTTVDSSAKFAMVACPTADVIATCTKPEGKDIFYKGAEPAPDAKDCSGTFKAMK